MAENSAPGASVGDPVTATDDDDDTLTYALTGSSNFTIDDAGRITVASGATLDYETQASYPVTVTAHDGENAAGESDTSVDDSIAVTITLTNMDEAGTVSLVRETGVPEAGSPLSAVLLDPDGGVTGLAWAWQRSVDQTTWEAIAGATGDAYTPTTDDEGKYLRATASYADGHGQGKSAQAATAIAVALPPAQPVQPPQLQTTGPTAWTVPVGWALIPKDSSNQPLFNLGDSFRLMFVTSTTTTTPENTDIATYNTYVQTRANTNTTLQLFKDQFRALISTSAVDARDNTATAPAGTSYTTGEGVPIYWLGGAKVADDYADFYDGTWDNQLGKYANGNTANAVAWTGSNADGTKHATAFAGASEVIWGSTSSNFSPISQAPASGGTGGYYALSPVITVSATPTIWSATLTVDKDGNNYGCDNDVSGQDNCSAAAALTDDDFTHGGTTYTVKHLYWDSNNDAVNLGFTSGTGAVNKAALSAFSLIVDGTALPIAVSETHSGSVFWSNLGLNWTDNQSLAVSLGGAPTITGMAITSNPASGDAYGYYETIRIAVTFSEAVTVTGTPTLKLEVGENTRQASYTGGSGTTVLTFSYQVLMDDVAPNGIYVSEGSLGARITLPGGATIKNSGDIPAALYYAAGLPQDADHKSDPTPREQTVPADWAYIPEGVKPGESFRLLFMSSTKRTAESRNEYDYVQAVRGLANNNNTLKPYKDHFRPLISTPFHDARDITGTTFTSSDKGVHIYWVNGAKAANNYEDFYDGSWDSHAARNESGTLYTNPGNERIWTGSSNDGTKKTDKWVGTTATANTVTAGEMVAGKEIDNGAAVYTKTQQRPVYGLSPVLTVDPTAPAPATVWSATLTADNEGTYFGCNNDNEDLDNCSLSAALTNDDFTYGNATYTFGQIYWDNVSNGTFYMVLNASPVAANTAIKTALSSLSLHLGSAELKIADTNTELDASALVWTAVNLGWADNEVVALSLKPTVTGPDITAPTVSSVAFTSSPASGQNSLFKIGDKITATATFSEAITVTGAPTLVIKVGGADKSAACAAHATNTAKLVCSYTVADGDTDADGIAIAQNKLAVSSGVTIKDGADNVAVLTHSAVAADSTRKVDGIRPKVTHFTMTSTPAQGGDTYWRGEKPEVTIHFSEPVTGSSNLSGSALTLDVHMNGPSRGTNGLNVLATSPAQDLTDVTSLRMGDIAIHQTHVSTAGIFVRTGSASLFLSSGRTIKDAAGNTADLDLGHLAGDASKVGPFPGHKVNGNLSSDTGLPNVTAGPAITSSPGSDQTYGTGDTIIVRLTFDEAIDVNNVVSLEIQVGDNTRQAKSPSDSLNTTTVDFSYTVVSGDADANGISIAANSVVLGSSTTSITRTNTNVMAALNHAALSDQSGHKVYTRAAKPKGFTAKAGNRKVTLSWTDPNDATITKYQVKQGNAAWADIAGSGATTTSHEITGLSNGTEYTFRIRAHDANGAGTPSDAATATPGVPAAVTGVAVTSAPGSDNAYTTGEAIVVTFTFGEAITVTGAPQLTITVGTGERSAACAAHATDNTKLVCTYTVQAGDVDADGFAVAANQLKTPTSVTIRNASDLDSDLNHAALTGHTVGTAPQPQSVSSVWRHIPKNNNGDPIFGVGQKFRLMFVTGGERKAASTDIADYNTFVQNQANQESALKPFKDEFRALISTETVDARDNTFTAYTSANKGVPIYWLREAKVADDYEDLYDANQWDSGVGRYQVSINVALARDEWYLNGSVWFGSKPDGTKSSYPAGANDVDVARIGSFHDLDPNIIAQPKGGSFRVLAMSPVLTVVAAPTITGVEVTSTPGSGNTYIDGEDIEVTFTFSEAITVTNIGSGATAKKPQLTIKMGADDKVIDCAAHSSENTKLVCAYTVAFGDADGDGIAVAANQLSLPADITGVPVTYATIQNAAGMDFNLAYPALPADADHKVLTPMWSSALTVSGPGLNGRTGCQGSTMSGLTACSAALSDADFTYGGVTYTFRYLNLLNGTLGLRFNVSSGSSANADVKAALSALTLHVGGKAFSFANAAAGDGIYWDNSGLSWSSGDTVRLSLTDAPTITAVAVTSSVPLVTPSERDPTLVYDDKEATYYYYRVGDKIEVTLTFSEAIAVTGKPQLTMRGGHEDWAADCTPNGGDDTNLTCGYSVRHSDLALVAECAVHASDNTKLVCTYTVQHGDTDYDGIEVEADRLALPAGAAIKDTAGTNDAILTHAAIAADSAHFVWAPEAAVTPDRFSVTPGDRQAALQWTIPRWDFYLARWQYRYKAGSGSYGSWRNIPGSSINSWTYTLRGLRNDTPYTIQIRGVNKRGVAGKPSVERTITPKALTAPAAQTVPANWRLIPDGVGPGESFRLMFLTYDLMKAESTDIEAYNDFVQAQAGSTTATDPPGGASVAELRPFSGEFRALISTATVDARNNTATTGRGVPIYWVRDGGIGNADKVADNYADFYDGSWDMPSYGYYQGGDQKKYGAVWTGSRGNGTKDALYPAGSILIGVRFGTISGTGVRIHGGDMKRRTPNRLYAISPVLTVAR